MNDGARVTASHARGRGWAGLVYPSCIRLHRTEDNSATTCPWRRNLATSDAPLLGVGTRSLRMAHPVVATAVLRASSDPGGVRKPPHASSRTVRESAFSLDRAWDLTICRSLPDSKPAASSILTWLHHPPSRCPAMQG